MRRPLPLYYNIDNQIVVITTSFHICCFSPSITNYVKKMHRFWYAIRTKPNKENVAAFNFQNQGYETYLPRISKIIRHARQASTVQRPLFPGYLFIHLSPAAECQWHSITSTYGTIGPVKFGDQYPVVPDQVIDRLHALENRKGFIDTTSFEKTYKPGQKIRLIADELEGLEGIFYAQSGSDRSLILLDFLGRTVKTTAPLHSLQAI